MRACRRCRAGVIKASLALHRVNEAPLQTVVGSSPTATAAKVAVPGYRQRVNCSYRPTTNGMVARVADAARASFPEMPSRKSIEQVIHPLEAPIRFTFTTCYPKRHP